MNEKITKEEFINLSNKVHNNKYKYDLSIYINKKTKLKIICNNHEVPFIFNQSPKSHLKGHGCIKCSGKYTSNKIEFIEKSTKIHYNKSYDYKLVNYINSKTKVCIICNNHDEPFIFKQSPNDHLTGYGYPKCCKTTKSNTLDFINKANLIHNNKYNYNLVEYKNNRTKIKIICNNHDIEVIFEQAPCSHLNGAECHTCAINTTINKLKLTNEEFINKAKLIHNNKYNYNLVDYKNTKTKVKIICNNHKKQYVFKQTPSDHLQGYACPKCSYNISKPEIIWLNSLNIKEENRQISLPNINQRYKVDGYDPLTNTVYEFYGDYWHGNLNIYDSNKMNKTIKKTFKQLYDKTMAREQLIKDAGYNLITIWESDFKKLTNKPSIISINISND